MKQVKAKYYADAECEEDKIEVIDDTPNLTALEGDAPVHPPSGEDEKGKWVLVNFVIDDDNFIEYDSASGKAKEIGETEWDQIKAEEASEITQTKQSSVQSAAESSSKNSVSTSTGRIAQIFTTVKRRLTRSIECLFSDV